MSRWSNRLQTLLTLSTAPILTAVTATRRWRGRGSSIRYFMASGDYPGYLVRGEAAASCLYHAKKYCHGRGVDVGAGKFPFPGARPIENNPDEHAYKIQEADGALDYVFSSHCLEHLDHWREALLEWRRALKSGGILYLYLPHPACLMWSPKSLHHHLWQPEPDALAEHVTSIGFEIIEHTLFPDSYMSFHIVARRL
ncbi:Class I SAM-dependent methyltransferase [Azospirillaceae bacterium]